MFSKKEGIGIDFLFVVGIFLICLISGLSLCYGESSSKGGIEEIFSCEVKGNKITLNSGYASFAIGRLNIYSILGVEKPFSKPALAHGYLRIIYGGEVFKFCELGRGIKELKLIEDTPQRKIVYYCRQDIPQCLFELNAEVRKGLPCLFVSTRFSNLSDKVIKYLHDFYDFGSWDEYVTDKDIFSSKPVSSGYHLSNLKWIFLKSSKEEYGLGLIPLSLRCMFDNGRLQTYPVNPDTRGGGGNITLEENDTIFTQFVIYPAKSPEEIKAFYEKIKGGEISLSLFQTPYETDI